MGDASATTIGGLDIGSPLYLHASDTTGASIVAVKLSGTENYKIGASDIKLALQTI